MLYNKTLVFWSLKKCSCANPSLWPQLKSQWSLLKSLECLINDFFQFPPCLVSVCSQIEFTSKPLSELLPLACPSIFSPSSHASSSTQPLVSFTFLTLSAAIFSHVCWLPFHVLFFSLLHLPVPQVHLYTPPPSCYAMSSLALLPVWLMWPLHLRDLASSAFLSFALHYFCFDLSTFNDTFFFIPSPRSLLNSLQSSFLFSDHLHVSVQPSPVAFQVTLCAATPRAVIAHTNVCLWVCRRGWEEKAWRTSGVFVLNHEEKQEAGGWVWEECIFCNITCALRPIG